MGLELFAMMFLVIHGGNGLARKVKVFLFCCWFWWKKFQMFTNFATHMTRPMKETSTHSATRSGEMASPWQAMYRGTT